MRVEIVIENTGARFFCETERTLLAAMENRRCSGIPIGCRNGGCGMCKIKVLSGRYIGEKWSRACVSESEEVQGFALACRTVPLTDLRVVALVQVRQIHPLNSKGVA